MTEGIQRRIYTNFTMETEENFKMVIFELSQKNLSVCRSAGNKLGKTEIRGKMWQI